MKPSEQQALREKIDLEASWDQIASDFYRTAEPLFGGDRLSLGTYGPFEDEIHTIKGDLRGKRVLIVGCGSGPDVVYCAKRGAIVTGLDFSKEQLRLAEQRLKETGTKATLKKVDLRVLTQEDLGEEPFDLILSNYTLQYIQDLPRIMKILSDALRTDGQLIISTDHPVLYATYPDVQQKNRHKNVVYLDYLRERTWFWSFRMSGKTVRSYTFHRTMGSWFRALHDAGLEVERIEEPAPTAASVFHLKKNRLLAERVPYTVIFVARKK